MRGGGQARKIGNAAEAYVAVVLRQEHPDWVVLPLQQDVPADLGALWLLPEPGWCLYEVKSSKVARRALSARLTPAEQDAFNLLAPEHYQVIRVLRHPGKGTLEPFEVLSRGA